MTQQVEVKTGPESQAPAEADPFRRARKRAEEIQGLYIHLLVFVLINAGLFLINLLTRGDGGGWWFFWPAAIWGIAVLVHVVVTFVPVFSPEWAERRAARLLKDRTS